MLGQDEEKLKMLLEFLKASVKHESWLTFPLFHIRLFTMPVWCFPQSQHMKMYIYQINHAETDFSEILSFIKRLTEWLFIKLHSPQDIDVVSPQSSFNFWRRGVSEMLGEILEHSCVYNLKEKLLVFAFRKGCEMRNSTGLKTLDCRKPDRKEILKLLKLIFLKHFFAKPIHLTFWF